MMRVRASVLMYISTYILRVSVSMCTHSKVRASVTKVGRMDLTIDT